MNLKNKVALISGGGQGIGAAIVRRFAQEGAIVAATDVAMDTVTALTETLNAQGHATLALRLDVTSADDWARVVADLSDRYGGVDILVNNAGILDMAPFGEIEEDAWDATMSVNAKGPFLGCQAVMASMRQRGGGAIVNVSSMAGISGARAAHYASSKGAVRLLTKSVALAGAKDNIRCNSIHPGMVETPMAEAAVSKPGARAERLARLPMGRFAEPSEIANVVAFLASDQASFMTGAEIPVDGGAVLT